MNTSIAFIGNGKEVRGSSEYDPLGKTVTPLSNGKIITKWHLLEAIESMHDADVEILCKLARKNDQTTLGQAMCWTTLMYRVSEYWAKVETRIEGEKKLEGDC
jgi:hypothetical protein